MNNTELSEALNNLMEVKSALRGFIDLIPSGTERDEFNTCIYVFLSKLELDLEQISLKLLSY